MIYLRTISTVLAENRSDKLERKSSGAKSGETASQRSTPRRSRIDPKNLEGIYSNVSIVHNAVNKFSQKLSDKGIKFTGENVEETEKFLSNIGRVGGNEHWDDLLDKIFRYPLIYGNHYVELVREKGGEEIVDLASIDPKKINYAKDGNDNIVLDEHDNPVGYVQKTGANIGERINQVYEPPKKVDIGDEIYIPAKNVAHFKLYTVGEGFNGMGIIEPNYDTVKRAYQLEKDYANKSHNALFPTRVAKVGDDRHTPTPEKINSMLNKLQEASSSTEIAVPYWIDLDMLEATSPQELIEYFNYFLDNFIAGSGVPRPFVRGSGEGVNKATLGYLDRSFNLTLNDIWKRHAKTIERQIIRPVLESKGMDKYPSINMDPSQEIDKEAPTDSPEETKVPDEK